MAKYSEAQNKATQKYIKANYDEYKIRMPKYKKEVYKSYAASQGSSLNQLFINLIEADMTKEQK